MITTIQSADDYNRVPAGTVILTHLEGVPIAAVKMPGGWWADTSAGPFDAASYRDFLGADIMVPADDLHEVQEALSALAFGPIPSNVEGATA